MINQMDGIGIYGEMLGYAVAILFAGSALLVFLYLRHKGRLDMDEEAKYQMLEMDEHRPGRKR
jgi:hypothetical protein